MSDIDNQIADLEKQVADLENTESEQTASVVEDTVSSATPSYDNASLEEIVSARVAEQLAEAKAGFKSKLDELYAARDEAVKQKVKLEEEKRASEIKRMEEEGRHKEVADLKLAELQAKVEALTARNTELSRDGVIRQEITGLDFRSEVAADMAYDRMKAEMIQDENGQWLHKSGVSIKEYVDHFSRADENAFLFKAKVNSGAGTQSPAAGAVKTTTDKKITEMTTEEMLAHFSQANPGATGRF